MSGKTLAQKRAAHIKRIEDLEQYPEELQEHVLETLGHAFNMCVAAVNSAQEEDPAAQRRQEQEMLTCLEQVLVWSGGLNILHERIALAARNIPPGSILDTHKIARSGEHSPALWNQQEEGFSACLAYARWIADTAFICPRETMADRRFVEAMMDLITGVADGNNVLNASTPAEFRRPGKPGLTVKQKAMRGLVEAAVKYMDAYRRQEAKLKGIHRTGWTQDRIRKHYQQRMAAAPGVVRLPPWSRNSDQILKLPDAALKRITDAARQHAESGKPPMPVETLELQYADWAGTMFRMLNLDPADLR